MPSFDLKGIKIAEYNAAESSVSYTNAQSIGDAMNVNLELRYAEGRLYAESAFAEYMKLAVGGTISIGLKYIPDEAQKVMFGSRETSYTVSGTSSANIKGLALGAKSVGKYVGVAFYAPDMRDKKKKFTCVKVNCALFSPPSLSYQTKGENIQFSTPTTTGEFLADDSDNQDMLEVAIVDTEELAKAWVEAVLT